MTGPALGEDAAVLRPSAGDLLIAAADPITFPTRRPGWYAVHVNANDIATRGGVPRWFLATLLLPSDASPDTATGLLDEVASACAEVGAHLVGGHTEITPSVRRPIISGCMLGVVPPDRLRRTGGAESGDHLVLSGYVGVEGTSVLASVAAAALRQSGMPADAISDAELLVERYGISVLPAARVATPLAHAMHDLTEGGLATAVLELAGASGVGAIVELDSVPILPLTSETCRALGLGPLGLLSSGSLLIAAPPDAASDLLRRLTVAHIPAAQIGKLTSDRGVWMERRGAREPLPEFARDEVARWLALAPGD